MLILKLQLWASFINPSSEDSQESYCFFLSINVASIIKIIWQEYLNFGIKTSFSKQYHLINKFNHTLFM